MSLPESSRSSDARRRAHRQTDDRPTTNRRRARRTLRPPLAAVGAFVLVMAGLGSAVGASVGEPLATADGVRLTDISKVTGSDVQVDVSRSFDRKRFDRQLRQQTAQRAIALKNLDADTQSYADEMKKAKDKKVAEAKRLRELNQWVLPVTGYNLTARFGQSSSLWSSGRHTGLDFAGPSGTPIVSVAAGTVKSAGYEGSYGNRTVITLRDGTDIWYCHQSRITVSAGDQVAPGQAIGNSGSTGNVTGPHLHLEVHPGGGAAVDPEPVLRQHDVQP